MGYRISLSTGITASVQTNLVLTDYLNNTVELRVLPVVDEVQHDAEGFGHTSTMPGKLPSFRRAFVSFCQKRRGLQETANHKGPLRDLF